MAPSLVLWGGLLGSCMGNGTGGMCNNYTAAAMMCTPVTVQSHGNHYICLYNRCMVCDYHTVHSLRK